MRSNIKNIFVRTFSTAAAICTALSCSTALNASAVDNISTDRNHGVGLTAEANRGSSRNQTTTASSSSGTDYERNASYYDIWREYNNLFRKPGSVKRGFFDAAGKFVGGEEGLYAAGDTHFYEVADFTLSREEIEVFLKCFGENWEDRFSSFSRYTSGTWENTFNRFFGDVTNKKLYEADKETYTEAVRKLAAAKYINEPDTSTAGSNPIEPDSLIEFLLSLLYGGDGDIFADRFYDDFCPISLKFDRSDLENDDFKDFLDSIYDAKETSEKGQDWQRWTAMDEIISEMFSAGSENIDFQSITEYIISDYEEDCMDNTEWIQKFDWGICGYSPDVNASDNSTLVSWDAPLYYLAMNEDHSTITVCFNTAGTYYISCAQHCNLVKQTKIEYVYQQYVYLMPYKVCVYVGNSFDNNSNWTRASTFYLDECVENETTYNIGEFAVHVTEDMVGRNLTINSDGESSSSFTTQRIS